MTRPASQPTNTNKEQGVVRGGLLRGDPSALAAQILLLGFVLGFAVAVATAIAALTADSTSGSSSSDAPSTALGGYLFLLALALIAAWSAWAQRKGGSGWTVWISGCGRRR